MAKDLRCGDGRRPVPDLPAARRLGRDEPRPRLLGRLSQPVHRRRRRPGRGRLRRSPSAAATTSRPRPSRPWPTSWSASPSTTCWPTWAATYRRFVYDPHLRWLGPEKGVVHMAIGAVVTALWDLKAKRAGQPLWQLVSAMTPEEIVGLVDFRYLTDALTPRRPWTSCGGRRPAATERTDRLLGRRLPGLHDHPGLAGLLRREDGPARPRGGRRRLRPDQAEGRREPGRRHPTSGLARQAVGPGHQDRRRRQPALGCRRGDRLGAASCSSSTSPGSRSRPAPTTWSATPPSARRLAPTPVATGEHTANRVMFKQLLQLGRHRRDADRRRPGGRGQREHRQPAAGREVRRPGLSRTPAGSGSARRSSTCP